MSLEYLIDLLIGWFMQQFYEKLEFCRYILLTHDSRKLSNIY